MRARVFLQDDGAYRLAAELDAFDADEVWRKLEARPWPAGRPMREDDIVYISDLYLRLGPDGQWLPVPPGPLTRELYQMVTAG